MSCANQGYVERHCTDSLEQSSRTGSTQIRHVDGENSSSSLSERYFNSNRKIVPHKDHYIDFAAEFNGSDDGSSAYTDHEALRWALDEPQVEFSRRTSSPGVEQRSRDNLDISHNSDRHYLHHFDVCQPLHSNASTGCVNFNREFCHVPATVATRTFLTQPSTRAADNTHLINMYLKLESLHSNLIERHYESIEVNSLLKSSVVSLERALADARRMHKEADNTGTEELQRENIALRDEIQFRAKELRDIYTGRLNQDANYCQPLATSQRTARAVEQELAAATQHQEHLKLALQATRQELSQERCRRVRAEGELKSTEYLQARPDWSRPTRADRLGLGLSTEEEEYARGNNP
uniref:Uncharacterized protein n=1 Tax=Cryptomonas curvata TaxID=233186 RepID=A0A7S0LX49_9CRYP